MDHFWIVFGPLLDHFWSTFGPLFGPFFCAHLGAHTLSAHQAVWGAAGEAPHGHGHRLPCFHLRSPVTGNSAGNHAATTLDFLKKTNVLTHFRKSDPSMAGTRLPGYPDACVPKYPGTRVPGYLGTQVPGYPGTRVPGYPGTWVPGYMGIRVPG